MRIVASILASIVTWSWAGAAQLQGTEYCNVRKTTDLARGLYWRRKHLAELQRNRLSPPRQQRDFTRSFRYIVPGTRYATGALIVKIRHKGIPRSSASNRLIDRKIVTRRPKYVSPCTKERKREFDKEVSSQRYVNYFFFGKSEPKLREDERLSNLHADMGKRSFLAAGTRSAPIPIICARTFSIERIDA